jgi:hypothetical protein
MAHEMAVMDTTGDTKVIWNVGNPDEVAAAKEMFKSLRKKGYLAYTVKDDGKKGTAITEFDMEIEKLIMIPPIVGG